MNIALDFDNTYTRDPTFWNKVCELAKERGHHVRCVTMRSQAESEDVEKTIGKVIGHENVYFTNRQAKSTFCFEHGIRIDVWIDDMPYFIENDAKA